VLRIGRSTSRQSRSPFIQDRTLITYEISCRITIDIPSKNRINPHFFANNVWVPDRSQKPTRDPDIICIICII
jgi:hypothetical protein